MVRRWLAGLVGRWKQPAPTVDDDLSPETRCALQRTFDLYDRYRRTRDLDALTDLVAAHRRVLATLPTDHPGRTMVLNTLASVLTDLFEETGDLATLTEAVQIGRAALAVTPADHPHYALSLSTLGTALHALFERTEDLTAQNEAVRLGRMAVAATPTDHPDHAEWLNNLGGSLLRLFEGTGDLATLTEAVQVGQEAVAATPTDQPSQAMCLNNLGIALLRLFERTGDLTTLTEAVHIGRAAVAATATRHPDQGAHLSNLGYALLRLFERTGDLTTLTEAVHIGRAAVAATTPTGHPRSALGNLGAALQKLFERTGDLTTLTEAVHIGRAAVAAAPTDRPDHATWLRNLGIALLRLFERTGDLTTLTEAVHIGRAAVAAAPTGHLHHAGSLGTLGHLLGVLFERTGDLTTLTEAVHIGQAAVAAAPTDHPDRATWLSNLGIALQVLYERTGEAAALTEARGAFADAAASPAAPIEVRISAGRLLGRAAMLAAEPEAALAALEAVVELVPQLAPQALSRADREHGLGRLAGLASEVAAVAVAAGRPGRAVELLEQTRGLLLGETIDARSDLTELRHAAPALAAEFDDLREQITTLEEAATSPPGLPTEPATLTDTAWEAHHRQATQLGEQRQELDQQWKTLVGRIRATAGWEQFLRPPPIARLHHLADAGPLVVVYVSRWRADALIVTPDPTHPVQIVALPDLTQDATIEQINRLRAAIDAASDDDVYLAGRAQREVHAVLGWLWDAITGPVLDHLGITRGERGSRPRVWWCPIGLLAYLPLHAAGHHTDTVATPVPRTVLDQVVSSYVITLRALEHIRAPRDTPRAAADSAVIVAMPTTPGASQLPGVVDEAQALARLLSSSETLTGPAATHQSVAAALPRHQIAHFACHGLSYPANPAGSRLLLFDHVQAPLTVAALMRLHLPDADLAYLSVCSTTETSQTLTDEAVHLTAAVQLAGYRHVIGTLWPINDTAAARIATGVYTLLTHNGTQPAHTRDSAHALAEATRNERDAYPALPTRWAAHLHLGA